jgi:hypothetical protein
MSKELEFYRGGEDGYVPGYGEVNDEAQIDWRAAWAAKLATKGEEPPMPVRYRRTDENGELDMQCNEENTRIAINDRVDDMDAIIIRDPRDGRDFILFRSILGNENFDKASFTLQEASAALVQKTVYPPKDLYSHWFANQKREIEEFADSALEEWANESGDQAQPVNFST